MADGHELQLRPVPVGLYAYPPATFTSVITPHFCHSPPCPINRIYFPTMHQVPLLHRHLTHRQAHQAWS